MFDFGTFDAATFDYAADVTTPTPAFVSAGGIYLEDDESQLAKRKRRRRKDLVDAEEALKAALTKASELKTKPKQALKEAVEVAKIALDLPGILSGEVAPLTNALQATAHVDAWDVMARAAEVRRIANDLIRKNEREARQREEDDDEEALMMLGF